MTKFCLQCGKSLSLIQRLATNYCSDCQEEIDRKQAESARMEVEESAKQEREATQTRRAAALQGKATPEDLQQLAAEGYLIAGNRLIQCPVCGHDRFHQQRTLMNTRAMTFLNFDWADSGADTRICQRCTYVMWFARG